MATYFHGLARMSEVQNSFQSRRRVALSTSAVQVRRENVQISPSAPPHPDTDANHHTQPSALKSHDCTTPNSIVGTTRSISRNKKFCPRRIPPRIPPDFDPCRAELTDPLVPLIRFRVAASRTSPFWRAARQAVRMWDACWAARLGGREVGTV